MPDKPPITPEVGDILRLTLTHQWNTDRVMDFIARNGNMVVVTQVYEDADLADSVVLGLENPTNGEKMQWNDDDDRMPEYDIRLLQEEFVVDEFTTAVYRSRPK